MLIHLHKQATTTPKVRAAIQASAEAAPVLAERFGITGQTVHKWRKRDSVEDRGHTPHRLQTTLTPAQEAVAVALRKTLPVSLDDLLAVVREFLNPNASRSGLDRCLRRHGVGNLRDLEDRAAGPEHSAFKAYQPGYIHIDLKYLPQMADESRRRHLFVAIDRATRWCSSASSPPRPRPMPGASCATWSAHARCGSAPYPPTTARCSPIASSACASGRPLASTTSPRSAPPWTSGTA